MSMTNEAWLTLDDAEMANVDLSWVAAGIGPRRRGTLYYGAYWGDMNQVVNVFVLANAERKATSYLIAERSVGQERIRRHSTSWEYDRGNRVHHGPADLRKRAV